MNWLSSLMALVSSVLSIYLVLLVVRIALTWVSMDPSHPALRVLSAVCDPYLNWFRRFRFLRWRQIDFSPLGALLVVNFFSSLAQSIGRYGQITLGIVLSIVVSLVWGAVSFIFLLMAVLALVRWLAVRFRWGGSSFWIVLDSVLQPPAYALGRRLRPGAFVSYPSTLLMLTVSSFLVWLGGNWLVNWALSALIQLPL